MEFPKNELVAKLRVRKDVRLKRLGLIVPSSPWLLRSRLMTRLHSSHVTPSQLQQFVPGIHVLNKKYEKPCLSWRSDVLSASTHWPRALQLVKKCPEKRESERSRRCRKAKKLIWNDSMWKKVQGHDFPDLRVNIWLC